MTTSFHKQYSGLNLREVLLLLRAMVTPTTVIHIGAGHGVGDTQVWRDWEVPRAIIIDADNDRLRRNELFCKPNLDWRAINCIVADITGEVEFHLASNPDENSLFPSEKLKCLWPNIRLIELQRRVAKSLDDILEELDFQIADFPEESVWTIVDCLPAERILSGVSSCLNQFSVVVARVLLPTSSYTEELGRLSAISNLLQNSGMMCISVSESNHPSIGYAVYVRDWRPVYQSLHKGQQHLVEELTSERIDKLAATKANQEKIRELLQLTRDQAVKIDEKTAVIAKLQEQLAELNEITRQQNLTIVEQAYQVETIKKISEQYKCALADGQAQINTLEIEYNRQALIIPERERDIDALRQRVEELTTDLAILRNAADQHLVTLRDRDAEFESLTNQFEAKSNVVIDYQSQIDVLVSENRQHNLTILERQHQVQSLEKIVEQYKEQVVALTIEQASQIELLAKQQIQLAELQVERDEQSQLQNERLLEIEKLANELAICMTRASELQNRNDILTQEAAQVEDYRSQIASISNNLREMQTQYELNTRAREEQTNRAEVLSVELETVNRSLETFRDEYHLLFNERNALLSSSETLLNDLNAKSFELVQAQSELERLRLDSERAIEQCKEQITRQQGFQTEFVRAEAQIELIKDLLLRESGL